MTKLLKKDVAFVSLLERLVLRMINSMWRRWRKLFGDFWHAAQKIRTNSAVTMLHGYRAGRLEWILIQATLFPTRVLRGGSTKRTRNTSRLIVI